MQAMVQNWIFNMMLEELWAEWKSHYSNLGIDYNRVCTDGVISPIHWEEAPQKVLYIMKEVNKQPNAHLPNMLQKGPKYQMWHTIARWSAGVINDFPEYQSIDTREIKKTSLLQVATLNLKKTSGGAQSDMSVINAYAKQDQVLLRKQIELIQPDIIICAGTYDSVLWLLDLPIDVDSPKSSIVRDTSGRLIVPWRHPARVNNKDTYIKLKKLFSEVNQ